MFTRKRPTRKFDLNMFVCAYKQDFLINSPEKNERGVFFTRPGKISRHNFFFFHASRNSQRSKIYNFRSSVGSDNFINKAKTFEAYNKILHMYLSTSHWFYNEVFYAVVCNMHQLNAFYKILSRILTRNSMTSLNNKESL